MDQLSSVLGRVAEELEEMAARLGAVTLTGDEALGAAALRAWQEVDQAQQRAQALAVIVGRLAGVAGPSPVNLDALTSGIGLDAVTCRIKAHVNIYKPEDDIELF